MLLQRPALQRLIRTARRQHQRPKHSLTWYSPMICTEISITNFVHPVIDLDQAERKRYFRPQPVAPLTLLQGSCPREIAIKSARNGRLFLPPREQGLVAA